MKTIAIIGGCLCVAASSLGQSAANTLTAAEQAAGWKLLFDGKSTDAWRGYRGKEFPSAGWAVDGDALKTASGGGDIITKAQYGDFELQLEWKASPKANSGIIYRCTEQHDASWQTGPEFQILEDSTYGAAATDMHSAGALYDLAAPAPEKLLKPAGEWNHGRIIWDDARIQHYVNGMKVVDVRTDGEDWKSRIAGSKFGAYEGFGVQPKGHIAIQDHGDTLWYRNIKVRDLDAPMPGEARLFNGKDLKGWVAFVPDKGGMTKEAFEVWSVKDGVLTCAGNPGGYIRTQKDYTNYVLKLKWRFDPAKGAGNSGALCRMVGEDKVWPKSVEAQLHSGNAGDFWNIDEFKMKVDPGRTQGRNTKKLAYHENPLGEWNEYEIIVDHATISLYVNGMLLNQATEVEEVPGKICLQSEGAEIQFKDIRLAEIK